MKRSPSLAGATLGFSLGAVGLASAFVLLATTAVIRAKTSHGAPSATDYRWALVLMLLLITGFFGAGFTARRAALPIPSSRAGFIAGLAGVTLLLSTMMLVGKPLGMRGPLIVAVLAGIASAGVASVAIRLANPVRVRSAEI